jgi:hypothetical protein
MATTRKHSMVMALLGALVAATVLALVLSGPAQAAAADLSIRKTTPDDSVQGGPCVVDFPRVVCNPGTIASGGKVTIKLTVRATEAGTLRNRARVSGSSTDTNAANNRAVSVVAAR